MVILDELVIAKPKTYLVVYFLKKKILAKIRYEIYNGKFLVIIEVFKTCRYYLKDYMDKGGVFIDYNTLCQFINKKRLSFC